MRQAFISDIHGNLKALEIALKQIKADEIYCLGDIVDRYPDSNKCIELVRKNCKATTLGNHDIFAAKYGYCDIEPIQKPDISKGEHLDPEIYRDLLTDENQKYLKNCSFEIELDKLFLAHTLHDIRFEPWLYIDNEESAFYGFGLLKKKIAAIGHTHEPKIFEEEKINEKEYEITRHVLGKDKNKLVLGIKENNRYIINVGSIGMGCAVGEYGIIEDNRLEIHRFKI